MCLYDVYVCECSCACACACEQTWSFRSACTTSRLIWPLSSHFVYAQYENKKQTHLSHRAAVTLLRELHTCIHTQIHAQYENKNQTHLSHSAAITVLRELSLVTLVRVVMEDVLKRRVGAI